MEEGVTILSVHVRTTCVEKRRLEEITNCTCVQGPCPVHEIRKVPDPVWVLIIEILKLLRLSLVETVALVDKVIESLKRI